MIRLITAGDRKIMLRLNHWAAPFWFRRWMTLASRAGDGGLWVAVGLAVLFAGGEGRFDALLAATTSLIAGLVTFSLLKRATGRERPCAVEEHVWATLLPPDRFSFPSGHTITAFTIAVPLGLSYHVFLGALIFCAMSIASSRVVLGLHYLSDVLAAIVIGCGFGITAFALLGPGL